MIFLTILLLITAIITFLLGCFCVAELSKENDEIIVAGAILFFFISVLSTCAYCSIDAEPKAIDVYRNKTALKITYEDNIPTDTTVIYKTNK